MGSAERGNSTEKNSQFFIVTMSMIQNMLDDIAVCKTCQKRLQKMRLQVSRWEKYGNGLVKA